MNLARRGNIRDVQGEVGIVTEISPSRGDPSNRFFLIMEYEDCEYMGCLMFTDNTFYRQIFTLLQA
jgi:hypothetical protein